MNAIELIQRLHEHRMWVNGNLLAAAAGLNDEQLRKPFEIGQGSVWKSLTHMYGAEYVWLAALEGNEQGVAPGDAPGKLAGNQQGENPIGSIDELRQKWAELSKRWTEYIASLTPESLDQLVHRRSITAAGPKRFAARRGDALLHVCTHAQYTAAQTVNMLRHSGVEKLPEVMLFALARKEASE